MIVDEIEIGLTPAQVEFRQSGLGASETAAALRMSPSRSPLEVWCAKRTPTRGPLIVPDAGPAAEVGQILESGLRTLFSIRTGLEARKPAAETLSDREHPWMLATLDGYVGTDAVLELKVVGSRMAHHWSDGVPDYVRIQVLQQLRVSDRIRAYVGALIGGTDFRVEIIERDADTEAMLVDAAGEFWTRHVLGDEAPEESDPELVKGYLKARYGRVLSKTPDVEDSEEIAQLHRWLSFGAAARKACDDRYEELTNAALAHIGERYGVEGPWGKIIAPSVRGHVDWKAIAERAGAIPEDVQETFRRNGSRQVRIYPPSKTKHEKLKSKRSYDL